MGRWRCIFTYCCPVRNQADNKRMTDRPGQSDARLAAMKVVQVLQGAGHVAYFAGGCVRDMQLGIKPKDYDVATDATPDQVAALFHRCRLVGAAFGVVLVRLMHCDIEVATFRRESGYSDGRRPDEVQFTDALEDARRRDFTINGLFYDPMADRVIDHVGGLADIRARVIRAIGEPEERFNEDYLRMLRAARFAARLGWPIDPATQGAIERHADKLAKISRERIGMEIQAMLEAPGRAAAIGWILQLGLDGSVLDEPAKRHELAITGALGEVVSYPLALAGWAVDRYVAAGGGIHEGLALWKPRQIARRWRGALVLSNEQHESLVFLVEGAGEVMKWFNLSVARRKRWLAEMRWGELEKLVLAIGRVRGGIEVGDFERDVAALVADGVGSEPLVSGDDLIAAGFAPGPMFKRLLDGVYDAQLEGRIRTREQGLALARELAGGE